ncbi:MAG: tetratricopeptide repeat protein [Planctomycetaceae bacterium]|nr:tetratricopeptide repeat protein [Planctomycetaceae bacterium]
MPEHVRLRYNQILKEAEGYLELNLPEQALAALDRAGEGGTFRGHVLYLRGEALRSLQRYPEALEALREAAEISPSNVHIWLALGWCYKRDGRIDLAIDSLEQAQVADPEPPTAALLFYNLACYWSLAGHKDEALSSLARALAIDSHYRDLVGSEPDFDPIRSDPEFRRLVSVIV